MAQKVLSNLQRNLHQQKVIYITNHKGHIMHLIKTNFYCIFIKWTLYLIDKADPPDTPGCWIRYPSGCPNQKHRPKYNSLQNPDNWNHETFKGASESSAKCLAREIPINNWCGISNIIIRFVEGIIQQSDYSYRK